MLIDIKLLGPWDGIDVLCAIRAAIPNGGRPAVVMTSGTREPSNGTLNAIAKHRAVFLPKPYSMEELHSAISMAKRAPAGWVTPRGAFELPRLRLA